MRVLVAVATFYIAAYSFLPHKELRFIFPVLPLLNAAAAAAAGRVWINRGKTFTSKVWTLAALAVAGAWALSLAAHFAFALAARHNYPGWGGERKRAHTTRTTFRLGVRRARVESARWTPLKLHTGCGGELCSHKRSIGPPALVTLTNRFVSSASLCTVDRTLL